MGNIQLITVGTGTCVPSIRRSGPCQCILVEGITIVIDMAAGSLRRLLRAGIRQSDIDLVLFTHFHPDHTGEIVPFIFASKYGSGFKRSKPVFIWGPEGIRQLLKGFERAWGEWAVPDETKIIFEELPIAIPTAQQFPPLMIKTIHVNHTPLSLAYRIETMEGKSVVVSGDTDFCDDIIEISRDADILVLECAAPEDKKVEGHLIPSEAGKIASEAGVKQLVLTHFYPECDKSDMVGPCQEHFNGPIVIAEDLMRIIV